MSTVLIVIMGGLLAVAASLVLGTPVPVFAWLAVTVVGLFLPIAWSALVGIVKDAEPDA